MPGNSSKGNYINCYKWINSFIEWTHDVLSSVTGDALHHFQLHGVVEALAAIFKAVGLIATVGDSVRHLKVGSPAAIKTFGGYSEFTMVPSKYILPVARPDHEVVAMLTSGLASSISLEKAAQMDHGKVVLVTAAAGGTGQFVVQSLDVLLTLVKEHFGSPNSYFFSEIC